MKPVTLHTTVNGRAVRAEIAPNRTLLALLRETLGLTGTKCGCEVGECGACTVLLDGVAVNSCLVLAPQVEGRRITTVEGLAGGETLAPLQEAFLEHDAVHCGFCTPGMLMSAQDLLAHNPSPTEREIRVAISGNLCRCSGYVQIVEAIDAAGAHRSRAANRTRGRIRDDHAESDGPGLRERPHAHLQRAGALRHAAGRAPTENFVQILERVWWRLDRALDERSLRASARLYAAESLLYGTTTLIDHQESPSFIEGSLDVLADACQEFGIRAVLCYGATDRNGGREEGRRGLAECRRFIRDNRRPLVRGVVGLHASFTCSDETLRESGELARELASVVHVHMAEDRADVEDARKRGYEGPLERLLATDSLPPGSIMAHGVHLEPSQVRVAESRGLWLVQNPRSNEGNRVGYASSLWVSGKVALGTDGWEADMPKEFAALERLSAGSVHEEVDAATRRLVTGRVLAAERLGGEPGGAGVEADQVVCAAGENDKPAQVSRVTVAGQVVVDQGRLVRGDLEELRAKAREEAKKLWPRMAAL